MNETETENEVARIAALDQPIRRDLYRLLTETDGWVSRDQAADALGLARSVAAFHLDKLADVGILEVRFERPAGRAGPGAGRPTKRYRPAAEEVSASVPDRSYDLAGLMLASAITESTATGEPVGACLRDVARTAGRDLAVAAESERAPRDDDGRAAVVTLLHENGYEPESDGGDIVLRNCPFHRLAEAQRPLVCGMNLDFLDGLLAGLGESRSLSARLDPQPGLCCVRISAV